MDLASNVTVTRRVFNDHDLSGLDQVKVLRMSGLHTFNVSDANLEKLRAFVKGGGLILADAQCGRDGFNESFPKFVEKLLPGSKLKNVMGSDAIITGQGLPRAGFDMVKARYKRVLKFNQFKPELQEVRLDGRRVIVYSPTDLTMGLDGADVWECKGLERNDAQKLCANIILSALPKTDDDASPGGDDAP
jgi:hypothetical protein